MSIKKIKKYLKINARALYKIYNLLYSFFLKKCNKKKKYIYIYIINY